MCRCRATLMPIASLAALSLSACSVIQSVPPVQSSAWTSATWLRNRSSSKLVQIEHQPPEGMLLAVLMTDGSILAEGAYGFDWYRFTPDERGDYVKGKWSPIASLPSGYAPEAFASAVLADGRLVISGGEYNVPSDGYPLQLVNLGAVYNPLANTWKRLGHPRRWGYIGDSPSTVLPDGSLLMGQKLTKRDAVLNAKTLKWTTAGDIGKADFNAEEGWTLLPDGTILTEDVKNAPNSEIYTPSTGKWTSAGSTIVDLHSPHQGGGCGRYGPKPKDCYYPPGEIGPAVLRPDGTVFCTGSGSGPSGFQAGHTAIYHTSGGKRGTWSVGPDFPNYDNAGDSYAILEPSGSVLVFSEKGELYEFNGTSLTQITGVGHPDSPILLPTGQVLILGFTAPNGAIYTPKGSPKQAWAPAVTRVEKSIVPGKTYKISGTQFNGLSQAMSFGDEFQNSTNYPLVRLQNVKTGHVYYARTHDHSTMAVATGSTAVWTYFDVPKPIEEGKSTLTVIANGIASKPIIVTVAHEL